MDPHLDGFNSNEPLPYQTGAFNNGSQQLHGYGAPHQQAFQQMPWMTHHTTVPVQSFPPTSSPLVFEGFVPNQQQPYRSSMLNAQERAQLDQTHDNSTSLYPDPEGYASEQPTPPSTSGLPEDPFDTELVRVRSNVNILHAATNGENAVRVRKKSTRGRRSGFGGPGRPKASGPGRPRGRPRGPKKHVEPGEQFTELHKQATDALIDEQDFDKAQKLILEAIKVNPEVYSAHALLSEILFSKGLDDLAIEALFTGAHVAPKDAEVWRQVANLCLERSNAERRSVLERARYCFSRLLEIDEKDYDAHFQRAAVNRELGMAPKALRDLEFVLKDMPFNSSVMQQIAAICLDFNQPEKPRLMYEEAMDARRSSGNDDDELFGWSHLITYVDVAAHYNNTEGIHALRRHSRWLLGRSSEVYWDKVEDDREWDLDNQRREDVSGFHDGLFPVETYGDGLPMELRVKLGLLRLRGDAAIRAEALSHFEWLRPEDHSEGALVYDYPDLFLEIARALNDVKEHEQALRYYEALRVAGTYNDTAFWLGIAASSYVCDKRGQAIEFYEVAREQDPTCAEARLQLSKLYTALGDRKNAMTTAREALEIAEGSVYQKTDRRKYERKDQRLVREAAEQALRTAYYKTSKPVKPSKPAPKELTPVTPEDLDPEEEQQVVEEQVGVEEVEEEQVEEEQVGDREQECVVVPAAVVTLDNAVELEPPQRKRKRKHEPAESRKKSKTHTAKELSRAPQEGADNRIDEAHDAVTDHETNDAETVRSLLTQLPDPPHRKRKRNQPPKIDEFTKKRNHEEQIGEYYSTLQHNTAAMRSGDPVARNIWMECAEALVDDFRHQKPFFSWDRVKFLKAQAKETRRESNIGTPNPQIDTTPDVNGDQDETQQPLEQDIVMPSIETDIGTHYCGIDFPEWFDVFLEYAMVLANYDEEPRPSTTCFEIINAAADCNIWSLDLDAMFKIHVCMFTCALTLRDESTLINKALRWFVREGWQFSTDAYRLFAALNLVFDRSGKPWDKEEAMNSAVFRKGPNQKFVYRTVVNFDARLPQDYNDNGVPLPEFMRKGYITATPVKSREEEDDESALAGSKLRPKEMDVLLLTLYAQILYAGDSFSNALSYFYRAYALDPNNATTLLSISLCYIHEMPKRQNDDRHAYLLQGLALFEEYVKARNEWASDQVESIQKAVKQETELNRARLWHMIGLNSLAVRGYKKMLDLGLRQEVDKDEEDFSMEAAYALSTIYALSGDSRTARKITERWLVVE